MGFFSWVKNLFRPLVRELWVVLKKIISGGTEIALARLKELAIEAVLMVARDPSIIKDEDKRKKAFDVIKDKAAEKGIAVRDSLINLALEIAVSYLKDTGRL